MARPAILYLGDSCLTGAAGYLAGVMSAAGWEFEYGSSAHRATKEQCQSSRKLFVLSDYPAQLLDAEGQQAVVRQVEQGAGLLMIGGWESFHGTGGNWDGTPVGGMLPVEISTTDDRFNFDQPALLQACQPHPVLADLPWDTRPPGIGGLNRFQPKADSQVLLQAQAFAVHLQGHQFHFTPGPLHPVLVVGKFGQGRTAAFATDVAPHWVGGLVDWGASRVKAQAPGAEEIEVGAYYAQFFQNLLRWVGNL